MGYFGGIRVKYKRGFFANFAHRLQSKCADRKGVLGVLSLETHVSRWRGATFCRAVSPDGAMGSSRRRVAVWRGRDEEAGPGAAANE